MTTTSSASDKAATTVTAGADAVHRYFGRDHVDLAGLAGWLDASSDALRTEVTRLLTPREQAKLFDAARGFRPVTLEHFVPEAMPVRTQVIHAGKNSLPVFTRFEKRFCRPEAGSSRLWGYNENPGSIKPLTGPGYFVCYAIDANEVLIDYTEVPNDRPAGWPRVRPNSAGLSRFIFDRTKDTMRGVSNHLSVGRAARDGKVMDNWFVLCRREGSAALAD